VGKVIGINKVEFYNTKNIVYFYKPEVLISGTVWGSRIINYIGKYAVFDTKN